jgi:hypothetical protein
MAEHQFFFFFGSLDQFISYIPTHIYVVAHFVIHALSWPGHSIIVHCLSKGWTGLVIECSRHAFTMSMSLHLLIT